MKLASAQITCNVGEIERNLEQHYQMVVLAAEKGADLITFPEMSITGYCRKEGKKLAFSEKDNRLNKLQELSSKKITLLLLEHLLKSMTTCTLVHLFYPQTEQFRFTQNSTYTLEKSCILILQ